MGLLSRWKNPASHWAFELFKKSPDALVVQDMQGRILAVNKALEQIVGLSETELTGRTLLELMPPAWQSRWEHDLANLVAGKWNICEGCLQRRGSTRCTPVDVAVVAHINYAGQPAVLLHLHDLSVFHKVETALMNAQQQWEISFDAITDCMCILDQAGRILRANRTMNELLSAGAAGRLIGRNFSEVLSPKNTADAELFKKTVEKAPFRLERITFNELKGVFGVTAYPLSSQEKQLLGAVLILRDITSQVQTEEALRRNEQNLRQAAKMEAIERLAGGIAHDFNNILTSVLGYGSMILKSLPPDSAVRADMQEIIKAAQRATALTRQLLNFSHERATETQALNLSVVVEDLINFLKRTIGEHIQVKTRLASDLSPIRADVSRIEQILLNLVINARDAMPQGGQLIIETNNFSADAEFCRTHPAVKPGDYVLLEVSDTGQGMPPEVMEHIFEPFFTTKPRGQGTGLGLTTIYGIVKQLDGHILCYSEVNKGTTFKIYLPATEAAPTKTKAESRMADWPGGTETILVVDDETNIVNMIRQILTGLGYHVITANTCSAALEAAGKHTGKIDLLLTDVIMPEMTGAELFKRLRAGHPELKALFMSGYADSAATQIAGLPLDVAFLQKPFSFDAMTRRVRFVLNGAASQKTT